MGSAGISSVVSIVTRSIFQAETGLVAFCYRPLRGGIQQVVMAELIHAVKMPIDERQDWIRTIPIQKTQ